MTEPIFTQHDRVERGGDSLQTTYMSTLDVVQRIVRDHLRPRLKLLLVSMASMAFIAAATGAMPFLIKLAADEVFLEQNRVMLYWLPLAVIVITSIKAIAEYVSFVAEAYIGHRVVADLRIQMFDKLTNADLGWLQRTHSGRFISSFLNDSNIIRDAAGRTLVALGQNILKVVFLIGAMFWMDWRLASLAVIALPVALYFMGRQRKQMRRSTTKSLQEMGDLGSLISQTLTGIRVVKAYQQEGRETARATATIDRTVEFIMRGVRARAASSPITEALTGFGFAAAIFYAGYQGIQGELTMGQFMGFIAAAMLAYQPLKSLAALHTSLQEGVAASNRVFGIIDQDLTVREAPAAKPLRINKGAITFQDVSFAYVDEQPVLRDFTLDVPPGKTVALVGPSGSGKSTVLNLLLRFFDPQSGSIQIDGQEISQATLASLRTSIALVTQDPFLFDDTIRANIAYGMDDIDEQAVFAAAKAAAADNFIARLPNGYDTRVGEAGGKLSGGERQRIAFARAMLRDAPILLLDEPTSSLDSEAEAQVQKALETLVKGRTVIMIAHRLSTVKTADLICVMNEGRIVETGRHSELMARGGLYAQFFKTQFSAEESLQPDTGSASKDTTKGRRRPAAAPQGAE